MTDYPEVTFDPLADDCTSGKYQNLPRAKSTTHDALVVPENVELSVKADFVPRMQITDDAIYVVHDDGFLRKYNLVGVTDDAFNPIPIT